MDDNSAAVTVRNMVSAELTTGLAHDGRRRRGQDNRARIVAAMLELIRSGQATPGAQLVAAKADVGLRTVFRHFKDMDSLYSEMSTVIEGELRTIADGPLRASHWRDRLIELIKRRALAFEKIAPFIIASNAYRHRSNFLQIDHTRLVKALRAVVEAELPKNLPINKSDVEILDLLLSFEAWSRLRREQGLSVREAQDALQLAVLRMITD